MFFTPNFGFISRKSTVQPVKYRSNMLEWWCFRRKLLQGKRNEQKVKQQALGSENYAIFYALPEVLVKNEETYFIRRKFHRKLWLSKYFLLFITETRICLGSKYLMFFTILFTKLPLYAFHYPFPIDALCLKKFQFRLDSYFSSYSVWYFSSS